jgi:hypothetical protein
MHAALDLGARHVGQAVHQKFINSHQALFGIGNDPVVLEEEIVLFV